MNKTKIEWCDKTLNPVRCIDPLSGGLYPPLMCAPGGYKRGWDAVRKDPPPGVGGGGEGVPPRARRGCALSFSRSTAAEAVAPRGAAGGWGRGRDGWAFPLALVVCFPRLVIRFD